MSTRSFISGNGDFFLLRARKQCLVGAEYVPAPLVRWRGALKTLQKHCRPARARAGRVNRGFIEHAKKPTFAKSPNGQNRS
jgi:hypothetical protein